MIIDPVLNFIIARTAEVAVLETVTFYSLVTHRTSSCLISVLPSALDEPIFRYGDASHYSFLATCQLD